MEIAVGVPSSHSPESQTERSDDLGIYSRFFLTKATLKLFKFDPLNLPYPSLSTFFPIHPKVICI